MDQDGTAVKDKILTNHCDNSACLQNQNQVKSFELDECFIGCNVNESTELDAFTQELTDLPYRISLQTSPLFPSGETLLS